MFQDIVLLLLLLLLLLFYVRYKPSFSLTMFIVFQLTNSKTKTEHNTPYISGCVFPEDTLLHIVLYMQSLDILN